MNIDNIFDQTIDAAGLPLTPSQKTQCKEAMDKMFTSGTLPYKALGFGTDLLEHLYGYGHGLYKSGNYKKAAEVFQALNILNPDDTRYIIAQAAALQKQKKYVEAIEAYSAYMKREPANPEPLYYLYDCYLQIGQMEQALESLMECIKRCGEIKEHGHLKAKCVMIIRTLLHEDETSDAKKMEEKPTVTTQKAG